MPPSKLGPARRAILEALAERDALTTDEIAAQLSWPATRRALQQHLGGLRDAGLVSETKTRPALGQGSPRAWTLLAAGRAALDEGVDQSAAPSAAPSITANRASVLELLAEWKQLTTVQIWRYLHSDLSLRYTQALLTELKRAGMVRDVSLDPGLGAAAEHYWMLLGRGANAIGREYDKQYRRRPGRALLAYRGLQLDLINQVAAAGWALHRPIPYSPSHPRPPETPQYRQLVAAIVKHEREEIARLMGAGHSPLSLQHRLARAEGGQVGALVQHGINEYVAYISGQPERTALLLPHPPYAGRAFWTRKPEPVQTRPEQPGRRDSRVDRYERLAAILPVIAIFLDDETAYQYVPLLHHAGFTWSTSERIAADLMHLTSDTAATA